MKSNIHWDLIHAVKEDDLTLAYTGIFEDSMTNRIIELSEAYLESHEQMGKLKRKASFLVAECFQNVVRHGSKETESAFFSMGSESFIIRFKNIEFDHGILQKNQINAASESFLQTLPETFADFFFSSCLHIWEYFIRINTGIFSG